MKLRYTWVLCMAIAASVLLAADPQQEPLPPELFPLYPLARAAIESSKVVEVDGEKWFEGQFYVAIEKSQDARGLAGLPDLSYRGPTSPRRTSSGRRASRLLS